MISIRLIPCLDIKDGRVVKGSSFVQLKDAGDPLELAKYYNSEGADELVFLDITASHESRAPVIELAAKVGEQVFIPFTVGGGIRTVQEIREALLAGADKVSLNTATLANPELIRESAEKFGNQCIVIAIDAKRVEDHWEVFTHGGRISTGMDAIEWARKAVSLGAGEILLTSMDEDGQNSGYDVELTQRVAKAVDVPVIASGGAGKPEHLVEVIKRGHADAVLLAGILHRGEYRIRDLKKFMAEHEIPVRLP